MVVDVDVVVVVGSGSVVVVLPGRSVVVVVLVVVVVASVLVVSDGVLSSWTVTSGAQSQTVSPTYDSAGRLVTQSAVGQTLWQAIGQPTSAATSK